ncbi:MAG: hypothetical protein HQL53_06740 [Magnetococcales bacterium]|nr:hypothetical protein [Magnetococcales bacterium]
MVYPTLIMLLSVAYWPLLREPYIWYNEHKILLYDNTACFADFPSNLLTWNCLFGWDESLHLYHVGRYLNAFINGLFFATLHDFDDFTRGRILSVALHMVTMIFTMRLFRYRMGMSLEQAGLLTFCMFLLPGMFLAIVNLPMIVSTQIVILMAIWSYSLIDRAHDSPSTHQATRLFISGYGLILMAMFIYPVNAFWLIVFTITRLFFPKNLPWQVLQKRTFQQILYFGAVSLLYFAIHKFLFLPYFYDYIGDHRIYFSAEYSFNLSLDILAKLPLIRDFFIFGMDGLLANDLPYFYWALLLGWVVMWRLGQPQGVWWKNRIGWKKRLLVMMALISSAAPNLVAQGGIIAYRVFLPFSAVVLVVTLFLFGRVTRSHRKIRIITAFVVACTMTIFGYRLAETMTVNSLTELHFLRQEFNNMFPWAPLTEQYRPDFEKDNPAIEIKQDKPFKTLLIEPNPGSRVDRRDALFESNWATNNMGDYAWAALYRLYRNRLMTPYIIEMEAPLHKAHALFVTGPNIKRYDLSDLPSYGVRVIDMERAGFQGSQIPIHPTFIKGKNYGWNDPVPAYLLKPPAGQSLIRIQATPDDQYAPPLLAFDRNPATYWEVKGPTQKRTLMLDLQTRCHRFSSYGLQAPLFSQFMARSWRVDGMEQNGKWHLVDQRINQPNWQNKEQRRFESQTPAHCYQKIRITFPPQNNPDKLLRISTVDFGA